MNVNQLKILIEESFPKLDSASSAFLPDAITSKEVDELRNDLRSFYSEDLPPYFGLVLYYSLNDLSDDKFDVNKYENFVYFLNANLANPCFAGEKLGRPKEDLQAELELRKERNEDFKIFTKSQSSAIQQWLQCAKNIGDLSFLDEDVDEAIAYWSMCTAE